MPLILTVFLAIAVAACSTDIHSSSNPPVDRNPTDNPAMRTESQNTQVILAEKNDSNRKDITKYAEISLRYLEREKSQYGLDHPRKQLMYKMESVDNLQKKHVKFQQVQNDIPVWGREMIVHLDEQDRVYLVTGEVLGGLRSINTVPGISLEDAARHVSYDGELKNGSLYIFNFDNENYLAYGFTLTKGLMRDFVFIDAHNGKLIHRISGTPTLH